MSIELIFAFVYSFRFIAKINPAWDNNGNFDLMYIIGFVLFFQYLFFDRKRLNRIVITFLPLLIIAVINATLTRMPYVMADSIMTLGKFFLCIVIMYGITQFFCKIDIQRCVNYIVDFYILLILIAFLIKNNILWRTAENRMELFYLEPGELSIHIALLLLIELFILCINSNINKRRIVFNMIILGFMLMICNGMSGILAAGVSLTFFMVIEGYKDVRTGKTTLKRLLLFAFFVLIAYLLLMTDNKFSHRLVGVVNGTDYSFETRNTRNYTRLWQYLNTSMGIGVGFGNMNSSAILLYFGGGIMTAAYPAMLLECGYLGLAWIVIFNGKMLWEALKRKNIIQITLLIFVNAYLMYGAYMTSPLVWLIYGMIRMPDGGKCFGSTKKEIYSR